MSSRKLHRPQLCLSDKNANEVYIVKIVEGISLCKVDKNLEYKFDWIN